MVYHKTWDEMKQARWAVLRELLDRDAYYSFKDEVQNYFMRPYWRKYYQEHKEHISEREKQRRYKCKCGSEIRKNYKAEHERTKKHQEYMANH